MILESDIGINIDGIMHVLFNKGTALPCEEDFVVEINSLVPILYFYQGQRVYVKDNSMIGKLELINTITGRFEITCKITDNTLSIIINEYKYEYSFINKLIGETNEEEEKIRNIESSKVKYISYINQTLHTLEQLKDKIDPYLIYKIKEARQIIYIEDVTCEEYELAQKQIEGWVNPKLKELI